MWGRRDGIEFLFIQPELALSLVNLVAWCEASQFVVPVWIRTLSGLRVISRDQAWSLREIVIHRWAAGFPQMTGRTRPERVDVGCDLCVLPMAWITGREAS